MPMASTSGAAASDPRANVSAAMPSNEPKTRARRAFGTERWISVRPGDVERRVGDADDGQQPDGQPSDRHDAEDGDRQPPDGESEGECRPQPPADHPQGRAGRPDQSTGTHRGIQPSDAALAEPEQLDRRRDEEHREEPANERLGREQPDDEARRGMLPQRAEATGELAQRSGARPGAMRLRHGA